MRIWSVHPAQLDRAALVSCWRETLLAQSVLSGRTKGYTRHPQLERWRATPEPHSAIVTYLHHVADEADARGYRFDRSRLDQVDQVDFTVPVTQGQLDYEWQHLGRKVRARDPQWWDRIRAEQPRPHPMLKLVDGAIEPWEIVK